MKLLLPKALRIAAIVIAVPIVGAITTVLIVLFGTGQMSQVAPSPRPRTVATAQMMSCAELQKHSDNYMINLLRSKKGRQIRLPNQEDCPRPKVSGSDR